MSKRVRNLVILVSVSAVVIGGLLALVFFGGGQTEDPSGQGQNKPNVQAVDPDIPILNHQAAGSAIVAQNIDVSNVVSNVATVTITNELDSFTVSPREVDGNMSVEAYHDMLRDADAIDLMCKHLTYLTAVAKPEKQEDMAAYGFDAPKATVEITYKDDETAAFEIGIESKG
ncbi:MAG: DUF4340 domain-containing protein, partial [Clostridia bacterium]|nr:DUF4340 domain-containing protein [Clostridia bacterium]